MINTNEIESKLRALKPNLSKDFNVEKIGYFGSYASGTHTEKSDLDLLVEFRKPLGWDFFDLKDLLESELKIEIDLVSKNALREQLKESILSQVKYI